MRVLRFGENGNRGLNRLVNFLLGDPGISLKKGSILLPATQEEARKHWGRGLNIASYSLFEKK